MKDKWPVAYKVAKNYTIDTDELNKMSGEVDLDGKTIEDVAAAWIAANEATWKAWAAVSPSRTGQAAPVGRSAGPSRDHDVPEGRMHERCG